MIGQDYSNGLVNIPAGGTLNLGSPSQRTSISIANSTAVTNTTYTGKFDLSGATLNAYVSDLVVGQRDGGAAGGTQGSLIGGNAGSIDIGVPGNTSNIYIGHTLNDSSQGNVDFSGLSTLNAHVNSILVGTAPAGAGAQGTFRLAANNTISANTIVVGSSGEGSDLLALGRNNTILTNQLTIAQDYSNATVTIPAGGALTLGSPTQRVTVSIASGATNTNNTYTGTLDLSGASVTAYFDSVVIGNKNQMPGGELGTLTLSDHADNHIEANSITIGGNQSTGNLNFGGGSLFAGSIAAGPGKANFNWTGGTLSVGSFGTAAIPFTLNNTGTGTLSPGSLSTPAATTNVFGNYTQGSAATMAIDIGGGGAGSDLVNISGKATFAGTLGLNFTNGFVPTLGQSVVIATYGSETGQFSLVTPPLHLPQDVAFQLDYSNPTQLAVRMVTPQVQNWIGSSGPLSTAGNWDINTVPGTSSSLSILNSTSSPAVVTASGPLTVHRVLLQGTTSAVSLQVPQGVTLNVANEVAVGSNATLSVGGKLNGDVTIGTAGAMQLSGGIVSGNVANDGAISIAAGTSVSLLGMLTGSGSVHIQSSAKLQLAPLANGGAESLGSLAIDTGGTLDLTSNVLAIHYGTGASPDAVIRALVLSGRNSGTGLISTTMSPGMVLGFEDQASIQTELIRATVPGDINLDEQVNIADLLTLVRNFGKTNAGWGMGDLNFDGKVNLADFQMLAGDFGQTVPSTMVAQYASMLEAEASQVPEPGELMLTLLAGGLILRRKRERSASQSSRGRSFGLEARWAFGSSCRLVDQVIALRSRRRNCGSLKSDGCPSDV